MSNAFGVVVTRLIKENFKSDVEFAKEYGCKKQYVTGLKAEGAKTIKSLNRLSNCFNLTSEEILKLVGEENALWNL